MFASTITPAPVRPTIARRPIAAARTATVEHNQWQRYPWMLRCYGAGVAVTCRGVPCHYSSEDKVRAVAAMWIATGVQSADQGAI